MHPIYNHYFYKYNFVDQDNGTQNITIEHAVCYQEMFMNYSNAARYNGTLTTAMVSDFDFAVKGEYDNYFNLTNEEVDIFIKSLQEIVPFKCIIKDNSFAGEHYKDLVITFTKESTHRQNCFVLTYIRWLFALCYSHYIRLGVLLIKNGYFKNTSFINVLHLLYVTYNLRSSDDMFIFECDNMIKVLSKNELQYISKKTEFWGTFLFKEGFTIPIDNPRFTVFNYDRLPFRHSFDYNILPEHSIYENILNCESAKEFIKPIYLSEEHINSLLINFEIMKKIKKNKKCTVI